MQHVRIGEHHVCASADLGAGLAWGVSVVDRWAHSLGQAERGQRPCLVLGESLGRVQVQRPRPRVAAEHVEGRQVEAHRLARCRARGDDRRSLPGGVDAPGPGGSTDARLPAAASAASTSGCSSSRGVDELRPPGPFPGLAHQPAVARPASSRALHGSARRSWATGCDSRGDVPLRRAPRRRSQRRAGETAHVPPFVVFPGAGIAAERAERGLSVSVCLPARECAGTVGEIVRRSRAAARGRGDRRDRGRRCRLCGRHRGGGRALRGGRLAAGRADALLRAGARQGGRDVARAVGARAASWSASWTPTPRASPAHFVTGLLGPLVCEPGVSFVKAFYRRPLVRDGVSADRGRRAREPPDGAPRARRSSTRSSRRCASRWRGRWPRGGSCWKRCRSPPAMAWRWRC